MPKSHYFNFLSMMLLCAFFIFYHLKKKNFDKRIFFISMFDNED